MVETGSAYRLTPHRLIFIMAAWTVMGIMGCGVKAPPQPPQIKPLVPMGAVTDLTATLDREAQTVKLTWSADRDNPDLAGYTIYNSRSALSQPPCQGCPDNFEKVGTCSIKGRPGSKPSYQFIYSAAPGFRYAIKVRPYLDNGVQGPASDVVMIEYPN